jgi:hypothetical protein
MKATTLQTKHSPFGFALLFVPIALAYFALAPITLAVDPAPDGGYPGGNTAEGDFSLFVLDTSQGFDNTAVGYQALRALSTGYGNTAIGYNALDLLGNGANNNIAIGYYAGTSIDAGSSNIDIGNAGKFGDSATIRIGTKGTHLKAFIAGIYGVPITNGLGVTIDKFGHLGTVASSARFKENIEPMDKTSEAILSLKPVTFRYKHELDPDGAPQFGLVAEDVEKINPDLVARDAQGKPYTVRYEEVNAMLLNEFLKEHRKVEQLEKQVAALTTGFQKVSARIQLNKTAPKTVAGGD